MNAFNKLFERLAFFRKVPFEVYLFIVWAFSILLVNPFGDFPLNDDWAYTKSVWNLCENGKLTIGDWPAMTLIGQVLPGAIFCYFFDFSFVSLRFYTLIISLIGVITFYNLAKSLSFNKNLVAFTCLLFFFHPLYFSLSFTFMTDVHFLTTMLLAIFFFYKYIEKERYGYIILAAVFSVVCSMIRQPGIVVPLAFAVTTIFRKQSFTRKILSFIPFIITLFSLFIHSFWLGQSTESTKNIVEFGDLPNLFSSVDLYQILVRVSDSMLYVGLFSFPMIVLFWKDIKNNFKASKRKFLIIGIAVSILLLIGGVHFPKGNIFYNLGLGPKLLKDSYGGENIYPQINHELWIILLKTISIVASLGLVFLFLQKNNFRNRAQQKKSHLHVHSLRLFILLTLIGYGSLIVLSSSYFDRYTLPLSACIVLLLLPSQITLTKKTTLFAIIGLLIMSFFSVSATHDYLSWNRARWNSLNYLMEHKRIKPTEIDGGFEYNAWYNSGVSLHPQTTKESKSWWFVEDDKYTLAFGEIDGFRKIKGFYYSSILSFKNDSIYILQKK